MEHRNMHRFLSMMYLLAMVGAWLDPLDVLTDTQDVWLFWCFLVWFGISRWFGFFSWLPPLLTGLGFILLFYAYFYFPEWRLFSLDWMKALGAELADSFPQLLLRDWMNMPPPVRTFYFFLLLWWFCAFLWQDVYRKKRALWFVVLSAVYFAVLDTFTPYDGRGGMMLTLVAGLLFLLWVRMSRLPREEFIRIRMQWWAGGLALVLLATSVAYAAPKPGPAWPDPIPWLLHGGAAGEGGALVRTAGYGSDDSRLGGAFVGDNRVVMRVRTTVPAYWRGESKDVYTGKGWLNGQTDRRTFRLLSPGEEVTGDYPRLFDAAAVDVVPVRQQVEWVGEAVRPSGRHRYPLFHQGMVTAIDDADVRMFVVGRDAHGIFALQQPPSFALIQGVLPVPDEERLRESGRQYPPEILLRYLQLPDIPERVRQLAETLTAGADNPYDKVKAVEAYLKSEEFTYDTRNVAVPEADEDFVDVFLFESKRGYCDYFSTAMVVLLRSVGIPARWVKGFTAGELVKKQGDGDEAWAAENGAYYEGTVSNRHAHSWVEVYFAGIGWIPFEATKGFSLPSAVVGEEGAADVADEETPSHEEANGEDERADDASDGAESESAWFSPLEGGTSAVGWLAAGGFVLFLFLLGGWLFRDFLWFRWQLSRWRRKDVNSDIFMRAYRKVLAALERETRRHPSETLREFVRRLQMEHVLLPQTRLYETLRFGDAADMGESYPWDEEVRLLYGVYRQVWRRRWTFLRRKAVRFRTFEQ